MRWHRGERRVSRSLIPSAGLGGPGISALRLPDVWLRLLPRQVLCRLCPALFRPSVPGFCIASLAGCIRALPPEMQVDWSAAGCKAPAAAR
jgi:hypothetical protein